MRASSAWNAPSSSRRREASPASTCDAHRWERLPTYASPARRLGGRGPMRLRQWLASGCVMAVAAGLTACGGSSGGGGGGGGSSTSAASSSLVVETAFVLKTLD